MKSMLCSFRSLFFRPKRRNIGGGKFCQRMNIANSVGKGHSLARCRTLNGTDLASIKSKLRRHITDLRPVELVSLVTWQSLHVPR